LILQAITNAIIEKKAEMKITQSKRDEQEVDEEGIDTLEEEEEEEKAKASKSLKKQRGAAMSQKITADLIKELRERTGIGNGKVQRSFRTSSWRHGPCYC